MAFLKIIIVSVFVVLSIGIIFAPISVDDGMNIVSAMVAGACLGVAIGLALCWEV